MEQSVITSKKNTKTKSNNAFWENVVQFLSSDRQVVESGAVILESSAKITSVILIFALVSTALSVALPTVAFYNDINKSEDNAFVAGKVDFAATSTPWNLTTLSISMEAGSSAEKLFSIDPAESNPFQYFASTTVSGDVDFCTGLQAAFSQDSNTLYSGSLNGLLTATTTSFSDFKLTASANANFYNKVCHFDLAFNGWQERHGFMDPAGFSDIEIANGSLASWGFRINKIYYDVSSDRGEEGENEWVEIYNQTDLAMDISGWQICDDNACDTIPASPSVPAKGYALITNKPNTASATGTPFWYLPPGVVYVPLNQKIGDGLTNTADMLVLKRPDGTILDQINWGRPNAGWANYNDGLWNPSATNANEGSVLTRQSSGYDTNSPSDWVEINPPVVNLIYPDEDGSYVWYWGYSYNIKWTATNQNGLDSDLNMDLYYIKDVDQSGNIGPGDTSHEIATGLQNDGIYKWKVPSGFTGYIWIKLVATGPENTLLNTLTISGLIYDPIPLYILPEGENPDMEAPVITPVGNNPALVPLGATYLDLGAVVTDNIFKNIGYTTEGDDVVDTSVLGEYLITYTATDQVGNVGRVERRVIVYDPVIGEPVLDKVVAEQKEVEGVGSGGGSVGGVVDGGDTIIDEMNDSFATSTDGVIGDSFSTSTESAVIDDVIEERASPTEDDNLSDEVIDISATSTNETTFEEIATSSADTIENPITDEEGLTEGGATNESGEPATQEVELLSEFVVLNKKDVIVPKSADTKPTKEEVGPKHADEDGDNTPVVSGKVE